MANVKTGATKVDPQLSRFIEERNARMHQHSATMAEHYLPVLQTRADAYADHIEHMNISPEMTLWALSMAAKYGTSFVQIHHYVADWITALLIMRYGEEPNAALSTDPNFKGWPTSFTAEDMRRAQEMLSGDFKRGAKFITPLYTEGAS